MGGIVNSILKPVAKLVGYDSNAIAQAGNDQAAATKAAAAQTAQANRDAAQAAQRSQETQLAQKQASDKAADLLNVPVAQADVTTGAKDATSVDTSTGKRVKPRDQYSNAGLNI
jgi:hypothetical protein